MFFERRSPIPRSESFEPDDHAGQVRKRVAAERPRAAGVGLGIGEYLVRDEHREIVPACEPEQVSELTTHPPEGFAALLGGAFQPVEARRAVEHDQRRALGELLGVPNRLFLLSEIQRLGDHDPRGETFEIGVARPRDLLEPLGREPLGVEIADRPATGGDIDRRRQRDVGLAGRRRAVHLRDGPTRQPTDEELVGGRTARRDRIAHTGDSHLPNKKEPIGPVSHPLLDADHPGVRFITPEAEHRGVIVVATEDFEVYHGVVTDLRERGVEFTTVEPGDAIPERARVLVTTADDEFGPEATADIERIDAEPGQPRAAVDAALATLRDGGRTIVGVDPGNRPGIAVLSGEVVVAAFHVPLADAAGVIADEIDDATDPVVRIGDGARLKGAALIDDLDIPVELVDETGTTPYLGAGARGMGDVLAAVNIARRSGDRIRERTVEPTVGELDVIKARSREQSEGNREIDEGLARRVAAGELTIEEALAKHRDR